jgi:adenine-specific DNA-methyltransferase
MALAACKLPVQSSPRPRSGEMPSEYASRLAAQFSGEMLLEPRRELAQFFTPLEVARFMAELARPSRSVRRLLDPGAGTGVLACALCEALPAGSNPVHLDAFEVDPALGGICNTTLAYTKRWLAEHGVAFTFTVHQADFVTEHASSLKPGLFDSPAIGKYDVAISNPPYFKLQKLDRRAVAAAAIVHGQPNIYALFMAITASLLAENGVMVTITPRSFAAGDYFRSFRQHLFATALPESVHVFHSMKETFRKDEVLQENVILRLRRKRLLPSATVAVSTSVGATDLEHRTIRKVALVSVVDPGSRDVVFSIPADETDDAVIRFVRGWPCTLHSLGLEVSTGPVVAFRARKLLLHEPGREKHIAPLLWLQNVKRMAIQWPIPLSSKPQYIVNNDESQPLLVRNTTCVVLRRFTAKEEHRRLTAAPLIGGELPGPAIGLENHLNYVYRPQGEVDRDEVIGLAALLGSALMDRYFRVSNGNTQVNATELRTLPLPPRLSLLMLGAEIRRQPVGLNEVDEVVAKLLHIPRALLKMMRVEGNGQG